MAAPGTYLSSFVENFLRSRGLEDQRSRAEAQEAGDIFKVERYLDELGRERGAEATVADMFRRQPQGIPPTQPGIPSAPPDWRATPSAPPSQPPSIAAGGAAAMQQGPTGAMPRRPPVMESVLQGVAPEAAARLFTTQTGRAALPSLEAAERERRKEEDHAKAEDFLKQGWDAFKRNEPAEAVKLWAKAYRWVGAHDRAGRMMEYGAKILTDNTELEKTKKDFAAFNAAIRADELDPSPENKAKVEQVFANAESLLGRERAVDLTKHRLAKMLDKDREIDAFLRHTMQRIVGPNSIPVEQAWKEAMEKYPNGFGKLWVQDMMNPDKPILPDFVREWMRLPPRVGKQDQSLTQRALFQAVQKAKEKGIAPSMSNLQFLRLWEETRLELKAADEAAGKTPEEKKKTAVDLGAAETRAEMAKLRLEAMKNPESLATKTSEELTRLIQRTNQDLKGDLTLEEEQDTKAYLSLLRKYRDAKARGKGETEAELTDKKAKAEQVINRLFPGKTWGQLTAAEKKKVADQVK